MGLRIGVVPGFDDELKGEGGDENDKENERENERENEKENENDKENEKDKEDENEKENDKEKENENETEAGRVGDLTYFSFFRAAAAGVNWGSSFTAAS